jgi:ATP-binding cassette, subfamily B, bacterial
MAATYTSRDREITRRIHALFWRASWVDKVGLLVCAGTRFPAMFLYEVLIPIQIAYGLQAIVTQRFETVTTYVFSIIALAVTYCVLWAVGGIFICRNGEVGVKYVQEKVFSNYLQKDYEFYTNTYVGALGAQASRLRETFNEYNQLMMLAIPRQAITIVASVIILAFQSLLIAAVTVFAMLFVLSFTIMSSKWRLRYRRQLSEASSELGGVIGDALGHATTVKSFAAESFEEHRLKSTLQRWGRVQYLSWISSVPADVGRVLLAVSTTAVLLYLTARLYQQGDITIAIVILVQLYVIRLIATTFHVAEIIKSYEATMGAAHESMKTMLVEPVVTDPVRPKQIPAKATLNLQFENVTYRYDDAKNDSKAVREFSLIVRPGEKVGLVGYSGSGKTTLTKLLLRFMDVADGSIKLAGIDLREMRQTDIRNKIAYVPQEPLLFHRTVLDNIAYGRPGASKAAILRAAKAAYVNEFVDELPKGYDTLVGERGVKLSGGQRQRVAIARALLKEAPILVLDEATSALDSRSEKLIQQALWRLMKGRTALVIAHRLSTIQRMDRIVVMDKGRIVQVGTHEELLRDTEGMYSALWTHQSGGYIGVPDKERTTQRILEK